MSDDDDWLHTIICFHILLIIDEIILYGFANFVEQHFVPYEYAGICVVVIEASKWRGFYCVMVIIKLRYLIGSL